MKKDYLLKPLLAMFMLMALAIPSWASGIETFDGIKSGSSSYSTGTFVGVDGGTWSYDQGRTDVSLDGKALTFRAKGYLASPTLQGGCASISFDWKREYSDKGNWDIDILVNDVVVANFSEAVGTQKEVYNYSFNLATPVEGDFTIKLQNNASKDMRLTIDNLSWVSPGSAPLGIMAVSPEEMSFVANIGEVSEAQSATLTLTDVDAATVTYSVTNDAFSVTKESDTQYNVVFNAPAEAGYYDATLTFTSSQEDVKPVSVALSGRSVDPNNKIENFHNLNVASGVSYNTTHSFTTDGYDFDGWSAESNVNSGDEFVKMGTSSNGGVLRNSGNFLERIPAGTEFTVQVWCAVWGTDNKTLTVNYGGNTKSVDVSVSIESPSGKSYNAENFTASTDFAFVKGSSNEITFTSDERLIIDKIALSYEDGSATVPYMEVSKNKLSFTANMGTFAAAQNVMLTLNNVEASTVSYTVDNEDFIVTPVNETEYSVVYKASPVKGSYNGTLTFSSTQEGIVPVTVSLEGTSVNPFANSGDLVALSSMDEISESDTYYMAAEYEGEYKIVNSISATSGGYFAVTASQTLQTTDAHFTIAPMEGGYSIYFSDGTYQGYVTPNNNNNVSLKDVAEPWNISYTDGYFIVEAIGTTEARQMAYNGSGSTNRIAPYRLSSMDGYSTYSTKMVLFKISSDFEVFPANGTEVSDKTITSRMYVQFDEQPQMAETSLIWVNAIPESDAVENTTLVSVPEASDYEMIATVDAANNRVYFKPNTWDTCLPLGVRYRVIFQENAVLYDGGVMSPAFGWEFNTVVPSGVEDAVKATGLSYDGYAVVSNNGNAVEVYNLSGMLVARSDNGKVVMQNLAKGIYVARSGNEVLKLVKR